jgi:hypothetical protein
VAVFGTPVDVSVPDRIGAADVDGVGVGVEPSVPVCDTVTLS